MNLDRRQCQLFGHLRILDRHGLIQRLTLDPFGHQRARCDRGTAAVGLEFCVFDQTVGADLDLQFHHVAASRCADHTSADRLVTLVESTHITGIFVVVQHFC